MKYLYIICLAIILTSCSSNITTTQEWIETQLESYCIGGAFDGTSDFHFQGTNMIIDSYYSSSERTYKHIDSIRIADIRNIVFQPQWYEGEITFVRIYFFLWENNRFDSFEEKDFNYDFVQNIIVPRDVLEGDMPERLEKSFRRLVKLHGGEMYKDVF